MIFNSYQFLIFFLIVYSLYRLSPHRAQNYLLLMASYVFYGAWDWRFLSLIWISTVVDYFCAIAIERTGGTSSKKRLLTISLLVNLGILAFFKYFNFFVESFQGMLTAFGAEVDPWVLNVVLPVGISFYTFQTLSYTIDVYRGKMKAERSFFDFALFVAFFPQLVAGPIERATSLMPQIKAPRTISWEDLNHGGWLIFWGLYKKIFVADNMAKIVDPVYADPGGYSAPWAILATYAFTIQLYCDFSGYTDIARGVARLMGFNLRLNFNQPYFSANPREYWQKWHISLSEWFRDYLYIPLGGSRCSAPRMYMNILITFAVSGLWHGAGWPFVIWGVIHGGALVVYTAMFSKDSVVWKPAGLKKLGLVLIWFHITVFAYAFFRGESISDVFVMGMQFFNDWEVSKSFLHSCFFFINLMVVFTAMELLIYFKKDYYTIFSWPTMWRVLLYLVLYFSITIFGALDGRQFVYFQF